MGDIYCGRIFILNDDIAEPPEEFTVIVISQNEEVGVVVDPEATVFVEDDDGKMMFFEQFHEFVFHYVYSGTLSNLDTFETEESVLINEAS